MKELFDLEIDRDTSLPPYMQIANWVVNAVNYGLYGNEKLPSVRGLAKQLGVSPNTVARAYSELKRRALVRSNGRAGFRILALDATQNPAELLFAELKEKATALGLTMEEAVVCLAGRVGLQVVQKPSESIVFLQGFPDQLERDSAQLEKALGVTVHRMRRSDLSARFEELKPILDQAALLVGNAWELNALQEILRARGVTYETVLVGEEMTPEAIEQVLAIPQGRRIGLVCWFKESLGIDERLIWTQTGREYRFVKAAARDEAALSVVLRKCNPILYTRPCRDLLVEHCPEGTELIHLEKGVCSTSIEVLRKRLGSFA